MSVTQLFNGRSPTSLDLSLVLNLSDGIERNADSVDAGVSNSLLPFIENNLKTTLWSKQREIVEAVDRYPRVAIGSCHALGKSFTMSRIVTAYLQTHRQSIIVTTAPTGRQVQHILWRYIRGIASSTKGLLGMPGHPLQTLWEIEPEWYAIGFKAADANTDAFQGFHAENILVIIDEAAGVSEMVYEVIESVLTGANAKLAIIGNTTSLSGSFRDAFHMNRHLWHTIKVSAEETPNFTQFGITRADMESGAWKDKVTGPMPYPALIDPTWVDRQIEIHGAESSYVESRIWAEFPKEGTNTLISLAHIERAENREDINDVGPQRVGIDVARFGDDETSMTLVQGENVIATESWKGADTTLSAGKVGSILADHGFGKAEVRVDATGLGAGLADRLREAGYDVVDVQFGAKSSDSNQWPNLRNEMWWELGVLFREDKIKSNGTLDEVMKGQLSDIRTSYLPGYTKPVIESKDAAKKRGRRSPDRAEGLMLALWSGNRKSQVVSVGGPRSTSNVFESFEDDPYDDRDGYGSTISEWG